MYATGRAPNTKSLGLEAAGVAIDKAGAIVADEWNRTSVENIYAVGDVTDRLQLTPIAIQEGRAVAETLEHLAFDLDVNLPDARQPLRDDWESANVFRGVAS